MLPAWMMTLSLWRENGAELDRENPLQQQFFHSRKGKEIEFKKRRAFVKRQRKFAKRSVNAKLIRPSEERAEQLSTNCMKLRLRLRREVGNREILTSLFVRSIRSLNLNDSVTSSTSTGRPGTERDIILYGGLELRSRLQEDHARENAKKLRN